MVKEGEEKLKRITDCSEKVIPNTLTEGQDVIFREVHDSQNQLAHLQNVISKVKYQIMKDSWHFANSLCSNHFYSFVS